MFPIHPRPPNFLPLPRVEPACLDLGPPEGVISPVPGQPKALLGGTSHMSMKVLESPIVASRSPSSLTQERRSSGLQVEERVPPPISDIVVFVCVSFKVITQTLWLMQRKGFR